MITIALNEADDLERERRRLQMAEPYRTILGHFRHEVGHHFWDVLVRDGGKPEVCRAVFGNDGADYEQALKNHLEGGAPPDWQQSSFHPMQHRTHGKTLPRPGLTTSISSTRWKWRLNLAST